MIWREVYIDRQLKFIVIPENDLKERIPKIWLLETCKQIWAEAWCFFFYDRLQFYRTKYIEVGRSTDPTTPVYKLDQYASSKWAILTRDVGATSRIKVWSFCNICRRRDGRGICQRSLTVLFEAVCTMGVSFCSCLGPFLPGQR